MKKIEVIFLLVCLTVSLLTACGSTSGMTTSPAEEDTTDIDETNAVTEPESSVQVEPKATEFPLNEGEIIAATFADIQAAVNNTEIKAIYILSAVDITAELSFERENDLTIHIMQEGTVTISELFSPVGCSIVNDGTMIVNHAFQRGISDLVNNGSITVTGGGEVSSGMSDTENHGTFNVESEGKLFIERGSVFNNMGILANDGYILINDGGNLNSEEGSIINNGTIDLNSYFSGDVNSITGTGILNDNRE